MRKRWLCALVLTLALALTSCQKRKVDYIAPQIGVGPCDDQSVGQFDVYVRMSPAQADMFEIYIVPYYLNDEGFVGQVNAFNAQPAAKLLQPYIIFYTGQTYFIGYLSADEVNYYTELAITPADPSTTFLDQQTDQFVRCAIPQPGDGTDSTGNLQDNRTNPRSAVLWKRITVTRPH